MKFSELAKYKKGSPLVVSVRHDEWMEKNSNPAYSEEALDFGREQMALQAMPRDRRGTISASSMGSCRRKQQFTFLGLPEIPPSAKLAGIYQNGTFTHLRWQMAGLTEGWLAEGEVPLPKDNPYRLSGTMDGLLYEGSVLEIKSINPNGFREVMSFGAKTEHQFQGATYLLATGREQVVFIYEDKGTQEYKEIVMTRDELPILEAEGLAERTWLMNDIQELEEPLLDCEAKQGWKYNGCPFRGHCLQIRSWKEAEEIADQARGRA